MLFFQCLRQKQQTIEAPVLELLKSLGSGW